MVCRMARSPDDLKRQGQGLERIGIDGEEPRQIRLLNRWILMLAFSEECQDLAEQPRLTAGASTLKRVLTPMQPVDGHRMKYHLGIRDGQHIIQESGMVIVGMGQKHILDFFRCDTCLFLLLRETLEAVGISCVNQDISVLVQTDEVVVNDPIAEVIDLHE